VSARAYAEGAIPAFTLCNWGKTLEKPQSGWSAAGIEPKTSWMLRHDNHVTEQRTVTVDGVWRDKKMLSIFAFLLSLQYTVLTLIWRLLGNFCSGRMDDDDMFGGMKKVGGNARTPRNPTYTILVQHSQYVLVTKYYMTGFESITLGIHV